MTENTITDDVEYFGTKELRWYQIAARNATIDALKNGVKRVLIVLPTGSGKTITVACSLNDPRMREVLGVTGNRKLRVLFAAHKHRLLNQAEATFAADSGIELIPHSIFVDLPTDVQWDVTVLDESHHEACATFQYQLERLGDRPIIGLTATPDRADGMLIKFEEIICPISRQQAVEEGWLARTYLNSVIDTPAADKTPALARLFAHYGHEMEQTMVFVRTKSEVRKVTNILRELGYVAESILDQSEREVNNILDRFSDREIQFVVNCNKINEGVDVKFCSTVVLGRQFGSYPQLNQVIGRASRPDSDCNVWELINPLSGRNLDTTVVVGTPERHRLISTVKGRYVEHEFNYVTKQQIFKSGIALQFRQFSE